MEIFREGMPLFLEHLLAHPTLPQGYGVPPLQGLRVVHLVRHPVDVVVRGYLYHKECRDEWWVN